MRRYERQVRLWSGLIIAVFVTGHLLNHAVAIHSLELAEVVRRALATVWHQRPMVYALYAAFLAHALLGLLVLYRRRTLAMPRWEAVQMLFGLAVVPLLALHVSATRGAHEALGTEVHYAQVALAIWSSDWNVVRQVLTVLVVWVHVCVGLHFWLRLRPFYPRFAPVANALAALVPVLALIGFARAGAQAAALREEPQRVAELMAGLGRPVREVVGFATGAEQALILTFLALLGLTLLARAVRARRLRTLGMVRLQLGDDRELLVPPGQSVLESLRAAGVAHASVCGGRARCTTCRIRVGAGGGDLDPPSSLEQAALTRIEAPPNVRLACQIRPRSALRFQALLPATASAHAARRPGGVSGREMTVTALFLDLRGSTRLGERKLPYDVLFILNQFFAEMAQALTETRGHYAQFGGDGLMALYGLRGQPREGARDALAGAQVMLERLAALNTRLGAELDAPLRVGIGAHTGDAIVGTMGPPASPNHSAIGDTINIAARLEAETKAFDCAAVFSVALLDVAGVDRSGLNRERVQVRGRTDGIEVVALHDAAAIGALLRQPVAVRDAGSQATGPVSVSRGKHARPARGSCHEERAGNPAVDPEG